LTARSARGTFRDGVRGARTEVSCISKLLLILFLATLIFGARRLPEIGAGLGKAVKNFKASLSGEDEIDVTPKKDEIADGKGPKS
jgi:sec-independent protein translocase protein TatA